MPTMIITTARSEERKGRGGGTTTGRCARGKKDKRGDEISPTRYKHCSFVWFRRGSVTRANYSIMLLLRGLEFFFVAVEIMEGTHCTTRHGRESRSLSIVVEK
jgi:hypothetical protein